MKSIVSTKIVFTLSIRLAELYVYFLEVVFISYFFQVFHACASLLKESYEEVGEVILHKLLSLLNEYSDLAGSCFDSIAVELVCYFIIRAFL